MLGRRARVGMLTEVAATKPQLRVPTRDDAEAAIARLREMSADVRGCAILGRDGELLAASGDPSRWQEAAAVLLGAADLAGDAPADRVHVATEDGEVFAVRHGGLAIVVVSDRFALGSLMAFDMRTVLRDLVRGRA
jgi:predicted regulator of Ras-like GTPase activity (Roadblock/LC7/MglB family)